MNYNKKCLKQSIPRNLIMTKKYREKQRSLAVPFEHGEIDEKFLKSIKSVDG